jgi:hypothetical protein
MIRDRLLRLAWPAGAVDLLLQAAARDDIGRAREAWQRWAAGSDIEAEPWSVVRLLVPVAGRLAEIDPESPLRGRIEGAVRLLWTQSQMALHESVGALDVLGGKGIDVIAFKGAGRAARDPQSLRRHLVNNIDALVPAERHEEAYEALLAAGWQPTAPGTPAYHRSTLRSRRGMRFASGASGTFDLHQSAFRRPARFPDDDSALWSRADRGSLLGRPVLVPSATDALLIAAAHGAVDGRDNSEWLLDIAASVRDRAFDWDLLLDGANQRALELPAAIALGYVAERLDGPVPEEVLTALKRTPGGARLLGGIILARPKSNPRSPLAPIGEVARQFSIESERRAWRRASGRVAVKTHWPRRLSLSRRAGAPLVTRAVVPTGAGVLRAGTRLALRLSLLIEAPPISRRIGLEVHVVGECRARLKFASPVRLGLLRLGYLIPLSLDRDSREISLVSAPAGHIRPRSDGAASARLAPLPFAVERASIDFV